MPNVMLVEDDIVLRVTFALRLRDHGHQVIEVADDLRARALIEDGAVIDVLVTDINLRSGTEGIDLAVWAQTRLPGLRVAVMTGRHDLLPAVKARCDAAVFLKPFPFEALSDYLRVAPATARDTGQQLDGRRPFRPD